MKIKIIYFLLLFFFIKVSSQVVPKMLKDMTYTPVLVNHGSLSADSFKIAINSDGVNGSMYIYKSNGLIKVLSNGLIDQSFGNSGVQANVLPWMFFSDIVIKNQYIYLSNQYEIARYDLNGIADLSFGTNGKITLPGVSIKSFVVNDDQSIYVLNSDGLKKVTPSGIIDNSFAQISNVSKFLVRNNSLIVLKSQASSDRYLSKYDSQGVLDTSFANNGELGSLEETIVDFKTTSTGNIVVAFNKNIGSGNPITLRKYLIGGSVDPSFIVNVGIINISITGESESIMKLDSSNNILIMGGRQVYRFTPDGMVDNTFNANHGYFVVPATISGSYLVSFYIINEDKILVLDKVRLSINSRDHVMSQFIRREYLEACLGVKRGKV